MLQFVLASKRDTNGRTLMGDLAAQSASAIQGLKPTISIVKMGGGQGEGSDSSAMKRTYMKRERDKCGFLMMLPLQPLPRSSRLCLPSLSSSSPKVSISRPLYSSISRALYPKRSNGCRSAVLQALCVSDNTFV